MEAQMAAAASATHCFLPTFACENSGKRLRPLAPKPKLSLCNSPNAHSHSQALLTRLWSSQSHGDSTWHAQSKPKRSKTDDSLCTDKTSATATATVSAAVTVTDGREKAKEGTAQNCGGSGTRWNPTPEQIRVLEMLYKSGMRTPNAEQIERVTAQLKQFGKIEGKNVFYWFQNHKARERQKQKRNASVSASAGTPPKKSSSPEANHKFNITSINSSYLKAPGLSLAGFENSSFLLSSSTPQHSKGSSLSLDLKTPAISLENREEEPELGVESGRCKRKSREWNLGAEDLSLHTESSSEQSVCLQTQNPSSFLKEEEAERELCTLKLFPLSPEGLNGLQMPCNSPNKSVESSTLF